MTETSTRELEALYRLAALASRSPGPAEAIAAVLEELVAFFAADSGSVSLVNPDTGYLEIEAHRGLPRDTGGFALRLGQGVTGWVALHGRPLLVPDVADDPRYIAARRAVRCEMAAPLNHGGRTVGVVNLDADQPGRFDAATLDRLVRLADEAARTLGCVWQQHHYRAHSSQLETLADLGQSLIRRLEEADLLNTVATSGRAIFDARLCTLHSHDAADRTLRLRAVAADSDLALRVPSGPFPARDSLLAAVLATRQPAEYQQLNLGQFADAADLPPGHDLRSALATPLFSDSAPVGVLTVFTTRPHRFDDAQKRALATLGNFAAVALQNARLYARVFESEESLRKNETLNTLGLLAAEIAHEIRNPLTVIKLLHGPLGSDFAPDDPRRRDLQVVTEKIEQLEDIVSRVLSFARAPGAVNSRWALAEIVDDTLLLLRAKLAQAGVRVDFAPPPRSAQVNVNKGQIQQVLFNVLLNALQAMPQGGVITLRSTTTTDRVALDITDTGGGIPPAMQSRLFEPFLSGRSGGTGLGLAITLRIMKDHRGDITLVQTGPGGTTMRLTLPLAAGP
jgi:signal transduction histidine kinase